MTDRRGSAFLLFLLTIYQVYHSAHCTPPKVNLDIPVPVVIVKEKELQQVELTPSPDQIQCSHTDGDPTRAYITAMNPNNPCKACFQILPCGLTSKDFCLVFMPSQGELDFKFVSSYVLTIACTDDKEIPQVASIEVRIIGNNPPRFVPPAQYVTTTMSGPQAGTAIYTVTATDDEGDAIEFFISVIPVYLTKFFDIGYTSGIIHSNVDMQSLCEATVSFSVSIKDPYHNPGAPKVIQITFLNINTPPQLPSDVTIQIPDRTDRNIIVYQLNATQLLNYTMKATPERGLEYYYLDRSNPKKPTIKTRHTIDYEYLQLRTVTLTIDVNDGYCKGPSQQVTMQITDVNDPPAVYPTKRVVTVYEGFINVDPQFNLIDPDENEKHKWSVTSITPKTFTSDLYVDTDTGQIFSVGEWDIDPNKEEQNITIILQVVDKDNATVTPVPTVTLIIRDKNDNTPKFKLPKYEFFASPCSRVGTEVGRVLAEEDDDSEFQGNDQLVFGGSSRNMSVMATGHVILTQPCEPVGAVDSLLATVTDQGLYPGPLAGIPVAVTLTCNPCPSPSPAPSTGNGNGTTSANKTGTTPGTGTGTDTGNAANFFDANLGWLVPAILLGCTLLGLLAYLLWRYCSRACARWKAARALRQKSAQIKSTKPKLPKKKKLQKPPPPIPPAPEPEPVLFGFWKETYPDRDQRHMPMREIKPASVEADKRVEEKEKKEEAEEKKRREMERQKELDRYRKELEEYHKKVDAINKANNSGDPPPPKKRCTIL